MSLRPLCLCALLWVCSRGLVRVVCRLMRCRVVRSVDKAVVVYYWISMLLVESYMRSAAICAVCCCFTFAPAIELLQLLGYTISICCCCCYFCCFCS